MEDRIEKSIELNAPVARVWRALTNHEEFGDWFRVRLDGPFAVGETSRGQMTYPGCEHLPWQAVVQAMEHERLFSFTWPQYDVEADVDYADEPWTLVEFRLEPTSTGTRLFITESGFSALPEGPRTKFMRMNERGWTEQLTNIQAYVRS
jgi:uncharacterized protein YndB with AHSA1/START domain